VAPAEVFTGSQEKQTQIATYLVQCFKGKQSLSSQAGLVSPPFYAYFIHTRVFFPHVQFLTVLYIDIIFKQPKKNQKHQIWMKAMFVLKHF